MKGRILQLILIALSLNPLVQGQALNRTAADNGSLAGTLTNTDGKPAAGVRMAALDISDTLGNDVALGALVSIAETDDDGHYRLESIPPGRYLITAGRVDIPTYYPGTIDRARAKAVMISSGAMITGIDFRMDDGSIRLFNSLNGLSPMPTVSISMPVDVKVEGGGRIPIFAFGKSPFIRLSRTFDQYSVEMKLNATSADVPLAGPGITEYRASVEDLPEGYVVKSILYGSTDLKVDTVKVTPPPGTASSVFASAAAYFAGLNAALALVNNNIANPPPRRVVPTPGIPQTPSPSLPISTLTVTLEVRSVSKPANGVRISGHSTSNGIRSAYISGIPGIYFSDGSFEFRAVPAGRQFISIVEQDTGSFYPRGASIIKEGMVVVVADQDIDNIELESITMLPPNAASLMSPGPATTHAPGPIKMSVIRGRVVDDTGQPLGGGTVTISAQPRTMIRIGSDGRFEIPRLLPGTYDLKIENFVHETVRRTVEIEESDIELDVTAAGL